MKEREEETSGFTPQKVVKIVVGCVIGVVALVLISSSYYLVSVGEVGVVFNKAGGNTYVAGQGFHLKVPFFEMVTKYDVQIQSINTLHECASKDLQLVKVQTIINLHLQADKVNEVYQKVGPNWVGKIVNPAAMQAVKSVTAMYNVEEMMEQRAAIKQKIEDILRIEYLKGNIVLETISLADIDFTAEYNKVIETKQIEKQNILVKENLRKQAEISKATMILNAEGEARKNQLMQSSATEQIIALEWIKKWKGDLPTTMLGDGKNIMISISHGEKK